MLEGARASRVEQETRGATADVVTIVKRGAWGRLFDTASLPSDRPRKRDAGYGERAAYSSISSAISAHELDVVRAFSEENHVDSSVVLIAALHALLYRYLGAVADEASSPTFFDLLSATASDEGARARDGMSGYHVGVGFHSATPEGADIAFVLAGDGHAAPGVWRYRDDIFDRETVLRIDGHFQRLLHGVLYSPRHPISRHDILSAPERRQVVAGWNDTSSDYPRERSLMSLFEDIVAAGPEAVALIDGDARLTYRQLNQRANQLARRLISNGVGPGVRVGLALERSASAIIAMLAVLKAGAAYVPLDMAYPPERIRFMIEDSALATVVTDGAGRQRLAVATRTVCVDVDDERSGISQESAHNLPDHATGASIGYVMYTSGSTGQPKGVETPQRAVVRLVRNTNYVDIGPTDIVGHVANIAFDAATFEVWGALLNGARLVILASDIILSPDAFADAIRRHKISALFLTSALFNLVAMQRPDTFATLRYLIVGGDAVDPRWARAVLQGGRPRYLVNGYGPTESTTFAITHAIEDVPDDASLVPIGRPIANTQAYILDARLQPAPTGVRGHLYLGGDGLAHGYLNCPALTAEAFIPDPFHPDSGKRLYRTGDIARFRGDGVIECLGRTDDQVKIRGFRIALGEIEGALKAHPHVRDGVVVAEDDAVSGKRLAAYVVAAPGRRPDGEELKRFLAGTLPAFMLPASIFFLKRLPLTPNGKIDRRALPTSAVAAAWRAEATVAPMSDVQQTVAAVWRSVLAIDTIGLDQNFFDLGGDSLRLSLVASKLKEVLPMPFSIVDLFRYPTIRSFTASLVAGMNRPTAPLAADDARARALKGRGALETLRPAQRG